MYRFRWNWKDAKQETQKYQFIWNGIQSTCTSRVECKCMQTSKKEHCWSLNGNHDSREYYVSNIAEMHIFYILNKNTITYALQQYICMTIKCSFFPFSFACAQNSIRIIWWCIFFGHKTDEMKSDFLKKNYDSHFACRKPVLKLHKPKHPTWETSNKRKRKIKKANEAKAIKICRKLPKPVGSFRYFDIINM